MIKAFLKPLVILCGIYVSGVLLIDEYHKTKPEPPKPKVEKFDTATSPSYKQIQHYERIRYLSPPGKEGKLITDSASLRLWNQQQDIQDMVDEAVENSIDH